MSFDTSLALRNRTTSKELLDVDEKGLGTLLTVLGKRTLTVKETQALNLVIAQEAINNRTEETEADLKNKIEELTREINGYLNENSELTSTNYKAKEIKKKQDTDFEKEEQKLQEQIKLVEEAINEMDLDIAYRKDDTKKAESSFLKINELISKAPQSLRC